MSASNILRSFRLQQPRSPAKQAPRYFQRNFASRANWYKTPPQQNAVKRYLNRFSSNQVVYAIMGVNVAVFGLWQYADASGRRFRDFKLQRWLRENLCVSNENLKSGRVWTLLTACFSHMKPDHLLLNLVSFYFLAPAVISTIGVAPFLSLYMLSGIGGSLIYLGFNSLFPPRYRLPDGRIVNTSGFSYANGASGSIYGTMSYFACLYPRATFLLFFVIPAPAFLLVPGLFAWDLYSAIKRPNSGVASAGHVGGALVGAGMYIMSRGRLRLR